MKINIFLKQNKMTKRKPKKRATALERRTYAESSKNSISETGNPENEEKMSKSKISSISSQSSDKSEKEDEKNKFLKNPLIADFDKTSV